MRYQYNDGGREAAGFKGSTRDCVVRAIAIATGRGYSTVYDELHKASKSYAAKRRDKVAKAIAKGGASPRDGVFKEVYKPYLEGLGWEWKPLMKIGSGCKVNMGRFYSWYLDQEDVPHEKVMILRLSKHLTAVVNGVIQDTHDPSRQGKRCVYGYYCKPQV